MAACSFVLLLVDRWVMLLVCVRGTLLIIFSAFNTEFLCFPRVRLLVCLLVFFPYFLIGSFNVSLYIFFPSGPLLFACWPELVRMVRSYKSHQMIYSLNSSFSLHTECICINYTHMKLCANSSRTKQKEPNYYYWA